MKTLCSLALWITLCAIAAAAPVTTPVPEPMPPAEEEELGAAPDSIELTDEVDTNPHRRAINLDNFDRGAVATFYKSQYRPTLGEWRPDREEGC
jgi:hypothetical protein